MKERNARVEDAKHVTFAGKVQPAEVWWAGPVTCGRHG
jgi:hypothetical protein